MNGPTLAALVLGGLGLCGAQDPTRAKRAFAVLEEARRMARHGGEQIWPGFSLEAIPIAIYDDERAWLVHHPDPPAGFETIDCERLSTPLQRGPRTAAMNANTSGELGGVTTAFVSLQSLGSGEIEARNAALIVHEAGHAFCARQPQQPARWRGEDPQLVSSYPSDSALNNAWGRIEGMILRDALMADDETQRLELARDFIAVRTRRQQGLEQAVAGFERGLELNEGLAEYFALRAVELAEPLDGAKYGAGGEYFTELLDDLAQLNSSGRGASRARFYSSGAAQGLLLDRLGAPWKPAIEKGGSLQELLAAAVGLRDLEAADIAARTQRIASERGFEALLQHEQVAARAARTARRSELVQLLAAPGRKLVLDLSAAGGAEDVRSFDPMNIVAVEAGVRVHTRMLRIAFHGGEAGFEQPAVQDVERALVIAALPDDALVELDGAAGTARVSGETLEVTPVEASWLELDELFILRPGAPDEAIDPTPYIELIEAARVESQQARPAPPFEVTDLEGSVHRLPETSARATALVFFSAAAWAQPGHRFVTELFAQLEADELSSSAARLLVIATQCSREELVTFLDGAPARHVIHDGDRSLAQSFGVTSYPTIVWVAAEGALEAPLEGYSEVRVAQLLRRLRSR